MTSARDAPLDSSSISSSDHTRVASTVTRAYAGISTETSAAVACSASSPAERIRHRSGCTRAEVLAVCEIRAHSWGIKRCDLCAYFITICILTGARDAPSDVYDDAIGSGVCATATVTIIAGSARHMAVLAHPITKIFGLRTAKHLIRCARCVLSARHSRSRLVGAGDRGARAACLPALDLLEVSQRTVTSRRLPSR